MFKLRVYTFAYFNAREKVANLIWLSLTFLHRLRKACELSHRIRNAERFGDIPEAFFPWVDHFQCVKILPVGSLPTSPMQRTLPKEQFWKLSSAYHRLWKILDAL